MPLSKELLEILACPVCKGALRLLDGEEALACDKCRLKYPIRDDIPVMLADEAERLD
ncbi:MAG: Trm112 family protein [Geobacteraceae bacterium]|nr:Trm112 family protein [Geobacteraceae bacterium]